MSEWRNNDGLFLSPDDTKELTGYTRKAEKCRELRKMGIRFMPNRLGEPMVMRDVLREQFGSRRREPSMPDIAALEVIQNGTAT
jgi:hypothetical protein